jgi:hypothetical protein
MTEAEWLECTDPTPMLEFLRRKASDRKLRLFAVACCRRGRHLMTDTRNRRAVEVTEQYADGFASDDELSDAITSGVCWAPVLYAARANAKLAVWFTARGEAYDAFPASARDAPWTQAKEEVWNSARIAAWLAQARLLREIFGNPFRPVTLNPLWFVWNDGTIPTLAQGIYDDRAFDRLPVLADALEEAGCNDAEILTHCRSEGEHTRGCWVVDLILGKQ